MKPRGGECDLSIGDLLCFTYVTHAIATNFLTQEINMGSWRNKLSEPFVHTMFTCVIFSVSYVVLPCLDEEYHPWDFVGDHILRTSPRPSVCVTVTGCEWTIFMWRKRIERKSNEVTFILVRIPCGVVVWQVGIPHDGDGRVRWSGVLFRSPRRTYLPQTFLVCWKRPVVSSPWRWRTRMTC